MERTNHAHTSSPSRLVAQSPPSILVVEQEPDLREFLRVSLQRWYQVAAAASGTEAVQHLEHCPPRALIVGQISTSGEEALRSALQDADNPPLLKLWSRCPPSGWADQSLRHPFMRVDLLRAVDQLVHAEDEHAETSDDAEPEVNGVEIETDPEA